MKLIAWFTNAVLRFCSPSSSLARQHHQHWHFCVTFCFYPRVFPLHFRHYFVRIAIYFFLSITLNNKLLYCWRYLVSKISSGRRFHWLSLDPVMRKSMWQCADRHYLFSSAIAQSQWYKGLIHFSTAVCVDGACTIRVCACFRPRSHCDKTVLSSRVRLCELGTRKRLSW